MGGPKAFAKLIRNLGYDAVRFFRFSSTFARREELARLAAHIKMDAHRIEKGLALPQPKPGFGTEVIARLIADVSSYERLGTGDKVTAMARRALEDYRRANRANEIANPALDTFLDGGPSCGNDAATIELSAASVLPRASIDFHHFAHSRHSLRQFSAQPVDFALIDAAVRAAERTPSVCNRQSARAYHITDPQLREKLLDVQGGNRGFGHQIAELMIVTSDLRNFVTAAERYQCWVDGGLFAMSLVYGLHAQGLGTCMLNWSVDPSRDIAARRHMGLSPSENIIVYIAVGNYPETFTVAASARLGMEDLLVRL